MKLVIVAVGTRMPAWVDTAFADFIEIHVYDLYLKYKIHSLVVSYGEEFKSYGSNVYPTLKKILDKEKQEKIKLASDEISLLDNNFEMEIPSVNALLEKFKRKTAPQKIALIVAIV